MDLTTTIKNTLEIAFPNQAAHVFSVGLFVVVLAIVCMAITLVYIQRRHIAPALCKQL